MDNNMTTAAAYMSGRSSSASSTGTGSSAGGPPGNGSSGDGRMAVIGVTRNVRLRRGYPGFGFSLRGGLEYGAGFYVSDVEPGSEAHRMGLRVGDQIIRMNGHPVEDAVHREIALLAKHRQDLVLKIRSVGMIPVKDNPNDPVTWHMVQQQHQQQQQMQQQHLLQQQQQTIQQQSHYKGSLSPYNQVRLRIHVGEKGRLGCGVCRGIVPGLTVQGTREGGPARAAGLKAGDVIIWCNGQRLTNIPFERAIEVMRGADVLEVVVNRPVMAHPPYDCPGTRPSAGYDMSRSLGPYSSAPSGIINLKGGWPVSMSTSSCSSSEWSSSPTDQGPEWSRKPNNTTVIRVNQNMNPGYPCHPAYRQNHVASPKADNNEEPLYDPVAPRDYESHDFDANPRDERNRRTSYDRDSAPPPPTYDSPTNDRNSYNIPKDNAHRQDNRLMESQSSERKTVTTVEVHQSNCPPAPPCMPPPIPHKWHPESKPMIAMGMQMGSTLSMGSTGSTETESSLESSCGKDSASTSSSLSTSSCEPASTASFASTVATTTATAAVVATGCANEKAPEPTPPRVVRACPTRNSPLPNTDLGTAITQELQRRAQQRILNAAKAEAAKESSCEMKKPQNAEALRAHENKVTHDKLMEEFKRAHRRMFNGNQQRVQFSDQRVDKEQEKRVTNGSTPGGPPPPPLPLPAEQSPPTAKSPEDAVEMQSIESFKLKESPSPMIPKPPSTYFSLSNSTGASSPTSSAGSPRHTLSPAKSQLNGTTGRSVNINSVNQSTATDQKRSSPPIAKTAPPVVPMSTFASGKIAVRIGAYEGETKQPSRLEFLPQPPRAPELPPARANVEELVDAPVVSRFQNELAATLQRSNLRKKTEGENSTTIESMTEAPTVPNGNSTAESENTGVSLLQSNVEKLAAALSNRVTIRVSPENASR